MAMLFSVQIDLAELMAAGPLVRAGVFNNLSMAVERVVQTGAERWRTAALKAPLWEGERQAYAASITARMTGPYSGEIVSDYKYVEDIESGRPAYDLKQMLNTSLKVRVSKKGRRYLIIPMRHNTPGNTALAAPMPRTVYAEAKALAPSRITGHGMRRSGTGAYLISNRMPVMVRARRYAWGGHLPAGLSEKIKPEHKTDPYAGMVRFKESKGGSTYLTFRVLSEGSSGWVIPPRLGLWIAKAVSDSIRRTAEKDFAAAMEMDLRAAS